jgi:hypothetical protein
MSTTPDLDRTIELVNDMLSQMKNKKDRLAAVDRLAKLYALKYRFSGDGKGSKFTSPTPEETDE